MAASAVAPSTPATAADDGVGLELDLYKLAGRRCADELTGLTAAAFRDLGALYRDGLGDQQTAALDRTLATLQQIDQVAAGLTMPADGGIFRLADLINEVCSLCGRKAIDRGIELVPLVFADLSVAYRGNPRVLRQLLVTLCTSLIDELAAGQLILRAMLADVAGDGSEDDADNGEALWITLEPGEQTANPNPPELTPTAPRLPGIGDVKPWLERTSTAGMRLSLSLTPATPTPDPQPPPRIDQAILFHHPSAIARSALGQRLRRLHVDARELEDLSSLDSGDEWQDIAALVLALPAGFEQADAPLARSPLPVIILSDLPSSIVAPSAQLPACIDDACLYRVLTTTIQRHSLAQPAPVHAPDAAAALTGGDPDLGERLLQMLIDELPTSLPALREAARLGDRQGLKDGIHKLKGGASYCGVPALHQVAVSLDQAALNAPMAQIELLLERLQAEAHALTHALARNTVMSNKPKAPP